MIVIVEHILPAGSWVMHITNIHLWIMAGLRAGEGPGVIQRVRSKMFYLIRILVDLYNHFLPHQTATTEDDARVYDDSHKRHNTRKPQEQFDEARWQKHSDFLD